MPKFLCVLMLSHVGRLAHWPNGPKNSCDSSQCCWSGARPMQWNQQYSKCMQKYKSLSHSALSYESGSFGLDWS